MPNDLSWTTVIAGYGAILATGTFVWNIVRELRDQGRLSVTAFIGRMIPDDGKDHFVVTMTYVGKRPLMVKGLAG